MAMHAEEIEKHLREAFPDGEIRIEDLAGDGDHFAVYVTSAAFKGKNRVMQHQMVYQALKGKVGETLHALAVQTIVKE